jgi:hypothetical protein
VVEGGDEQAGYEENLETERDLGGDQEVHQATAGVRVFAALNSADRLN